MLNTKLKSLFKRACYVTAIVLVCYLEGKYEVVTGLRSKLTMSSTKIYSSEFEVFGKVQGVFFRKNTEETATKLGIHGWVMNTQEGTVKGVIEGKEKPFNEMKQWLTKTGSPQSQIDRTVFSDAKIISEFNFPGLYIYKPPKQ